MQNTTPKVGSVRIARTHKLLALPIAMAAFMAAATVAPTARAATSSTSGATLTMDNFASVSSSGAFAVTPGQADFEAGFIEQAGAITLDVMTNDATGCTISVNGTSAATLKNEDLLIKSATSGTDSAFATYAATPEASTVLWSTNSAQPIGTQVTVDVKVQNLRTYAGGASGAGSTASYTNTLVFDVLPNS